MIDRQTAMGLLKDHPHDDPSHLVLVLDEVNKYWGFVRFPAIIAGPIDHDRLIVMFESSVQQIKSVVGQTVDQEVVPILSYIGHYHASLLLRDSNHCISVIDANARSISSHVGLE